MPSHVLDDGFGNIGYVHAIILHKDKYHCVNEFAQSCDLSQTISFGFNGLGAWESTYATIIK